MKNKKYNYLKSYSAEVRCPFYRSAIEHGSHHRILCEVKNKEIGGKKQFLTFLNNNCCKTQPHNCAEYTKGMFLADSPCYDCNEKICKDKHCEQWKVYFFDKWEEVCKMVLTRAREYDIMNNREGHDRVGDTSEK